MRIPDLCISLALRSNVASMSILSESHFAKCRAISAVKQTAPDKMLGAQAPRRSRARWKLLKKCQTQTVIQSFQSFPAIQCFISRRAPHKDENWVRYTKCASR